MPIVPISSGSFADEAKLLRAVVDTAGCVIVGLRADHTVFAWNRAAEALYQTPRGAAFGRDYVATFLAPEHRAAVAADIKEVLRGKVTSGFEDDSILPDGTRRTLIWNVTRVLDSAGEAVGVIAIGQDITERRELERRLATARKLEAVGELAGGVAHDFNNLLAGVRNTVELAQATLPRGSPAYGELSLALEFAERAAALTRQLLAFSRRRPPSLERFDWAERLRDVLPLLRRSMPPGVALEAELPATPVIVEADPDRLDRVPWNLVLNARDATDGDGRIRLRLSVQADKAALEVEDDGVGMDEETRRRCCEPFFTTKELGRGTGLGLAVVYGAVTEAGGRLDVRSTPGRGSCFTAEIPLTAGAATPAPPAGAAPARDGAGRLVLVVDDEPGVRVTTRRLLEARGWRVVEASDGEQGLAQWRSRRAEIDVVLTDLRMPRLDGAGLAACVRAEDPRAAIVVFSGYDAGANRDSGVLATCGFLAKPFAASALYAALEAAITRAAAGENGGRPAAADRP
jgi:PAS domain S-box-containing protein